MLTLFILVARTYTGEMTKVGESVAITGVMHIEDLFSESNKEVGYFNMIDGTAERESYGKDDRQSMVS